MSGLFWFMIPFWLACTIAVLLALAGIAGLVLTFLDSVWYEMLKKAYHKVCGTGEPMRGSRL